MEKEEEEEKRKRKESLNVWFKSELAGDHSMLSKDLILIHLAIDRYGLQISTARRRRVHNSVDIAQSCGSVYGVYERTIQNSVCNNDR